MEYFFLMVFICHPATKMPGCALGLRRSWTGLSSFDVMLFALPTFFPLPILIPGYSFVLILLKIFFKFLTSYLNFGRNYHLYSPLPILTAVCISSICSIIILPVFPLHPPSSFSSFCSLSSLLLPSVLCVSSFSTYLLIR